MSYSVLIPISGHAGWAFLNRTRAQQQAALNESPALKRLTEHFAERIAAITTAEDLVADRALRAVALGAFGLQDDMENRAFLIKVLESNSYDETALTGRLADKRYLGLARSFGFGDLGGARTGDPGFAERITAAYQQQQFEVSVGETDSTLRLALGLGRELAELNKRHRLSADARWFSVMASPTLRSVFETALGLPESFGSLDIDQQLLTFRERAQSRFGTSEIRDFSNSLLLEELTMQFLSGAEAKALMSRNTGSGQIALSLLASIERRAI